MIPFLLVIGTAVSLSSCEKLTHVYYFRQSGLSGASEMRIKSISPLSIKGGETMTIVGESLNNATLVKIGTYVTKLTTWDGHSGTFTMANPPHPGAFRVAVGHGDDFSGSVDAPAKYVLADTAGDGIPIFTGSAQLICSSMQYRDADGVLQNGSKQCASSGANSSPVCTTDGQAGCLVDGSAFKAASVTNLVASNIKSGAAIGGVTGSLTVETHSNCSTDGATGCVAVAAYPAALASGAASKILSGQTLAGTSGNVTLPAAGKVYTGVAYGVGGIGSTGTLTIPAAANVLNTAPAYGDPGTQLTPSLTSRGSWDLTTAFPGAGFYSGTSNTPAASTIASGTTIIGVAGTATLSPANCTADGSTGCVTTANYKAANMSVAIAGNIRSGVTIAGVSGSVTAESHSNCAADGASGCVVDGTSYKSAKLSNFDATKVQLGTTIAGVTGSATADPWNVRAGATINGVTGKLKVSCRNRANPNIFDIDAGRSVYQIVSHIMFTTAPHGLVGNDAVRLNYSVAPSGANNTTTYYVQYNDPGTFYLLDTLGGNNVVNISGGSNITVHKWQASQQSIDVWDTIDDYNSAITSLPPNTVTGWSSDTDCGGMEAAADDSNVWKDVTTTSDGAASKCATDGARCTMQDKITGLWWSKLQPSSAWWQAVTNCQSLNYNGQSGWRLPTQKELMEGYNHGIRSAASAFWMTEISMNVNFWSSSTVSHNTNYAWLVDLANGYTNYDSKGNSYNVVCVRS